VVDGSELKKDSPAEYNVEIYNASVEVKLYKGAGERRGPIWREGLYA
jgi:hypothetical protein